MKSKVCTLLASIGLIFMTMFMFATAFADDLVTAPAGDISNGDFLSQVVQAVRGMHGLKGYALVVIILTLIIGSMKVSFLREKLWDKLGAAKVWLAPVLALILGIADLGAHGTLSVAAVIAYVSAGGGAVALHEILDSLKALPGLGQVYITIIDLIKSVTGGNTDNTPKIS